ncbi:histidine phosphatase family protein [Sulfitobacter sp. D35]|uniref:histidine phosphatase family protein n=1 Tax=Sulfitobacter sp. D35 TaxID=3083252 RepID=UPI00296EC35E|nr:histidine phosphatase family protein [Sulfitobacter sp. D35]MDW4496727.1 histidine phosphatase family protein [Sulfitobacter sp. D35]
MSLYPPLYVLRHGQTEWNAARRLQGHLDSPLTERGRAEALQQRDILAACDLVGYRAICSPQGRAFQTAALALIGLVPEIRTDGRLREIGVGDWAGTGLDELEARGMTLGDSDGSLMHYDRAPGGEGFVALHDRCTRFLDALDGPAILVTHGVTSRMLRLIVVGRSISDIDTMTGGQGVVYRLENGHQERLAIGA